MRFTGEDYTVAKIKIEEAILKAKEGIPQQINRIFDIITVNYSLANF